MENYGSLAHNCDLRRRMLTQGAAIEIQVTEDPRTLRIAARFFDRSSATMIFKRGLDAYNHPDFYRQLGEQPDEITANAVTALVERFGGG